MSIVEAERPVKAAKTAPEKAKQAEPPAPTWLELESIKPIESTKPDVISVEDITSLSAETIISEFPQYVVRLTERRIGMKLRHALEIAKGRKGA